MTEDWSVSGVSALRLRLGEPASTEPELFALDAPHSLTTIALALTARTKAQEDQLAKEEHALVEPFSPLFVYPIYGEEETIFGYKGLDIDVRRGIPAFV